MPPDAIPFDLPFTSPAIAVLSRLVSVINNAAVYLKYGFLL